MPDSPSNWEELLLESAAARIEYPPTPPLASAVSAALAKQTPQRRLRPHPAARLALAALAVIVAATAAALILMKDVRESVADFLGLAVEGEEIRILPTPAPGVTPTPFPTPQGLSSVATPVSREAVTARLGFAPQFVPGQPEPAIYVAPYVGVTVLVLDYPEFDLWETDNGLFEKLAAVGSFEKGAPAGTVEQVTVNGRPAYWLSGREGHIVRFIGADGKEAAGSQRTVLGNTLAWHGERLNYRLETELPRERAIAIAETLP